MTRCAPNLTLQLSLLLDTQRVTLRDSVATHGYIGLGFSPGGGMHGADNMLAWVDTPLQSQRHMHMKDRYWVGKNVPGLSPHLGLREGNQHCDCSDLLIPVLEHV